MLGFQTYVFPNIQGFLKYEYNRTESGLGASRPQKNKNAAEVDITPALGKITKNVKYMSRAPGQEVL